MFLADGTANCVIYFNNYVIVTSKLLSLGQMLLRPILFIIVIMVHDVIEPFPIWLGYLSW